MNSAWLTSEETTYLVSMPERGSAGAGEARSAGAGEARSAGAGEARSAGAGEARSAGAGEARSAIAELVERVYAHETRARRILRERIFATSPATLAERELVKVAAKRLEAPAERPPPTGANVVRLAEAPPLPDFGIPEAPVGSEIADTELPRLLELLKGRTTRARERWSSDRPVGAILVGADRRILATAWNTNATIRTRHAERNLCETLARGGRKIPVGATLYVSLKPCRMCAAAIWEAAEDPASLNVVYSENDPGPMAQGTMLEPRSAARVRYLGLDHPLFAAEISRQAP